LNPNLSDLSVWNLATKFCA